MSWQDKVLAFFNVLSGLASLLGSIEKPLILSRVLRAAVCVLHIFSKKNLGAADPHFLVTLLNLLLLFRDIIWASLGV